MKVKLYAAGLLALMCAAPAIGAVVTYDVDGLIFYVSPELASEFSVGESIKGSFSYNTNAVDLEPSPESGTYLASFNVNLMYGDYAVSGSGGKRP